MKHLGKTIGIATVLIVFGVVITQSNNLSTTVPPLVGALVAVALVGGLFVTERMNISYVQSLPETKVHTAMAYAKSQGTSLRDAKRNLIAEGWPKHIVDIATVRHVIEHLESKGHNMTVIKRALHDKGYGSKHITYALLNKKLAEGIAQRKTISQVKKELLAEGFDKEDIDLKFAR